MLNESIYIYIGIIVFLISVFFIYKKQKNNSQTSLLLETNGVFKHNKANGITIILSGIFLIGLFIFIGFKDPDATLNGLLVGLVLGTLFGLIGTGFLLFNFKAFFYIDNGHIKGKYHYFGKINCNIGDVAFTLGRNQTLIIQLKDGKTYTIMGIENAWQLASIIRQNMPFEVAEQPETLIEELNKLKSSKKKGLVYVCFGLALMFINIFITVFLTNDREMHEFNITDWTVFAIMCVIEIVTVIVTFFFASKTGKNNVTIEKLKYSIQRTIIESYPLLPGNVIKVFSDENYTGRITLFGYPNNDSVYYTVQEFASDYTFFKTYESEIFENAEQLQDGFEALIDITDKVLH